MTDDEKLLIELEQRCKSNTHRIDDLERVVDVIHELSTSIKLMGQDVKALTEETKAQGVRLEKLESIPADNWKAVIRTLITAAASALAGAALTLILK